MRVVAGVCSPVGPSSARRANGMSAKNAGALQRLGCSCLAGAQEAISGEILRLGGHPALACHWRREAAPEEWEVAFCETGRARMACWEKLWLKHWLTHERVVHDGSWWRELSSWHWHVAIHGWQARQQRDLHCAKPETVESRVLYSGPASLKALSVWAVARLSDGDLASLTQAKARSWCRLAQFDPQADGEVASMEKTRRALRAWRDRACGNS